MLYGAGNGIGSVARGTAPLALFGSGRYPGFDGALCLSTIGSDGRVTLSGGLSFQKGGAEWTFSLLTSLALVNVPSGGSPEARYAALRYGPMVEGG